MTRSSKWTRGLRSVARFAYGRLAGYPLLVNLEVTRRCNARCDFCRYWHTRREASLDDYVDVVRALHPLAVMFTGGEPLLRRDLERLVSRVRERCPGAYLGMVTNGALLTVDRGLALWRAGLDQLGISLDFPDQRHDVARGIPGLAARVMDVAPRLAAAGVDNLVIQTVIKSDNLDCVLDIVGWVAANGLRTGISAYTPAKADNHAHDVEPAQLATLRHVVDELLRLKAETSAVASSSYYLRHIPDYFAEGGIPGCLAGRAFLTVSPAGEIQRCSESPVHGGWQSFRPGCFGPTGCRACWTSCRGECQAPLGWELILQAASTWRRRSPGRGGAAPAAPLEPAPIAAGLGAREAA
jgi:MoaA/NifB/PqqE/SkfB family radical SAM enzyme